MKKNLLLPLVLMTISLGSLAQNVFNPGDAIIRYNSAGMSGSPEKPDPARPGLQKWVSSATVGVSLGNDSFNAASFKAYYINAAGGQMAFRIKFPYSYSKPEGINKKYPVMLFLHGSGEVGCSVNGGVYNNEKQLVLGGSLFMQRADSNLFDGFLVYPQLVSATNCSGAWGSAASSNFSAIIAMIDSMVKYTRADIDRLLVDGLSGGGYGAWRMADSYPQRVAKIMPSASAGGTSNRNAFVHIPIWFGTGGKDPDPSPQQAQYTLTRMKEIGADIRYSLYPLLGHAMWYSHWREADFVAAMNDVHKANPLVFFKKNEFCPGETVNAHLGLTQGFYAYEWQKDNVTIASAANGTNTINNSNAVISYTGNEINVKLLGTYRARFKRYASSVWSDWSPKPVVVKTKTIVPAPAITVSGVRSKVLPAPDGSNTVPLQMPEEFINYEWIRVSDNVKVSAERVYNAPVGVYKARYDESPGCGPSYSPNFTVVSNGSTATPRPEAPTGLKATTESSTSVRLNWVDHANEKWFEIYRSGNSGGPYELITMTNPSKITYLDKTILPNTTYYYIIRATSEKGAAPVTAEVSPNGGNKAPVITELSDMYVKSNGSAEETFNVSDSVGDVINVTIPSKPAYLTLAKINATTYRITVSPTVDNVGWNYIKVVATDNKGMYSTKVLSVLVTDKNTRSVYINFGSPGKTAPIPWNNWLGARAANNTISNLMDENNSASTFAVTTINAWSGTTDLGHLTGNNSGVYPDSVLQSGIADNGTARQIRVSGLNPSKKYNLVFTGSQNEGLVATAEYAIGSKKSAVDARYNTQQTANLNGLIPDAGGQVLVNITRTSVSLFTYLNAMVIEEYINSSLSLLNPDNLFVEPLTATSVQLSWSDRTASENAASGYQLIRAKDSLFTSSVVTKDLPGNTTGYTVTGLTGNTKYWFRVRAKNGTSYSEYSNRAGTITPGTLIYVNFNTTVADGPGPWNNLVSSPLSAFTVNHLKNQAGASTNVGITMEAPFNGEFTAGMSTGDNSGVVPDNVLMSDYWLDNTQLSQFRVFGLNKSRRYRFGFFGSSGPNGWFKGNYTATYTINDRTVYLNSWQNTSKIVYIADVVPDATGKVLLNFSTTANADWGFNAGMIIEEYTDAQGGSVNSSVLDSALEWNVDSKIMMFPNPFKETINMDLYNNSAENVVSAEIYDLHGRLVFYNNFGHIPTGHNTLRLDARSIYSEAGMYIIALKINGKIMYSGKLLHKKN